MDEITLAANQLVDLAAPFIKANDLDGLAARLQTNWTSDCLLLLLDSQNSSVIQTVLLCLGLIGSTAVASTVASYLHHQNETIVNSAEDALWSISFRAGGPLPQAVLNKIAASINEGETENVISMLTQLIKSHPTYGEAFHQRSQAYYLQQAYQPALKDARRAFSLNPFHFSALSIQGHCLVAMDRLREGLDCYQRVLAIHPRMVEISDFVRQLRIKLAPKNLEAIPS